MTTDEKLDRAHELDDLLGTVADAMRTEVLLVDPDTPADVAARRLEREGISSARVVRHGHVVGMVTLRDLFAVGKPHEATQTTCGPALRPERCTVSTSTAGWRCLTAATATARTRWLSAT